MKFIWKFILSKDKYKWVWYHIIQSTKSGGDIHNFERRR